MLNCCQRNLLGVTVIQDEDITARFRNTLATRPQSIGITLVTTLSVDQRRWLHLRSCPLGFPASGLIHWNQ